MERRFALHLSLYTTLALAALSLGFANTFFLPWLPWLMLVLFIISWSAWKREGQWQMSEGAANSIGLVIGLGMFGWILFKIPRTEEELLATGVPWPAGLLPHLGPLLMILTTVKLFRPKKVSDFWVLQVLGVMMVTLASVLAGELNHGLWIFLYLASLIWCMAHFHRLKRDWVGLTAEERRELPLFPHDVAPTILRVKRIPDGLSAAIGWSILASGVGGLLFLIAPRHTGVQWIPHKLTVGAVSRAQGQLDAGMDLNRTGKVELSEEVAFEASAQDADGSTVDLPGDLYWRGEILDFYQDGRWFSGVQSSDAWGEFPRTRGGDRGRARETPPLRILSVPPLFGSPHPSTRPDDIPAEFTYITIRTRPELGNSLVLAEPIDPDAGVGLYPHLRDRPSRSGIFGHLVICDTILPLLQTRRTTFLYGQAVDLRAAAETTPRPASALHPRYVESMLRQSPPDELRPWARRVLMRQSDLSAAARTLDEYNHVAPEHHAAVARAVTRYFAESGDYLYSLNLRRVDAELDPNVDFLLNVKEGHCERYASGLALTLRALGIPSRIVHGYRGGERTDDHQVLVRFSQAHSWVQALVPADTEDGFAWLLLDPTPSQAAPLQRWEAVWEWFDGAFRRARAFFHGGVLDYGSDQQLALLQSWWNGVRSIGRNGLTDPWTWTFLVIAAGCAWRFGRAPLKCWWPGDHARIRESRPWLADALRMIQDRHRLAPAASQTLREFSEHLSSTPAAALAPPFTLLAKFADQITFAQRPLTPTDRDEIAAALATITAEAANGPL